MKPTGLCLCAFNSIWFILDLYNTLFMIPQAVFMKYDVGSFENYF